MPITALLLVGLFVAFRAFLLPRMSVQFQQFTENLPRSRLRFRTDSQATMRGGA